MCNYATGAALRPKWATAWCDMCATNVKITLFFNSMVNWISILRNQIIGLKPFEAILLLVCSDWRWNDQFWPLWLYFHTLVIYSSQGCQNGCASPLNANWPIKRLHLICELDKSWKSVFSFEVCLRVLWGRGPAFWRSSPTPPPHG